jgi:3-deoxy-D-manno-octulosonic-acid transferase
VVALYLLYRGIRDRAYFAHLPERLGILAPAYKATGSRVIWFHAVSVGEVLSAVELIRRLQEDEPGLSIYLSTTTLTGRAAAVQRLASLPLRASRHLEDRVFYLPLDYRSMIRRVLRRLRPSAVVILETEIWPNLYRESKRAGASLMMVNARISDRSLPSYRRASGFFRHVLCWPDAILAQTEEDARRLRLAGAPDAIVTAAGNLKFDFNPPVSGIAPDIAAFLQGRASIWIAASTMPPNAAGDPDEDDAVISAFLKLDRPGLLLILAARHPQRFDAVAEKLTRAGIPFARRTALPSAQSDARVLLLDSIGELTALFERATVVFMGGTLASRGGHNILEPAYFSKPVIAGPHMENFAAIAQEFTAQRALLRIASADDLTAAVASLLDDPARAQAIGSKARELAMSKRGVVERVASEVREAVGLGVPDPPRTLLARTCLTPLSWIWRAGHSANLSRPPRALSTKVVSIGGLAMGGVGKTPVVARLVECLTAAGKEPAILTRGYQRRSSEVVIVPRGKPASVELTGDEAQMFIRSGHAHVGIGADRLSVGRQMERQLHPDVFLLDDGFQHTRLKRDEDIVLIDALDPLAGGVFPLGRLREPFENLARATAVIVTRVERGQGIAGIERLIRRYNRAAPIFRCRMAPKKWIRVGDGLQEAQPFRRVGAFCGLGSPNSFWRTLDQLGLKVAFREAFRDHHPYSLSDLERLVAQASAQGVDALVTTEKDTMNLGEGASALFRSCPLYWLKLGVEIENEAELLRRVL